MKNKITLLVLLVFGVFTLLPNKVLAQINCSTPTSLVTSGQADNSFVLSWSTNSTTNALYTIRYQIAGTSNWTSITSTHSPFTLSGLNCSTSYIWQVQQVCQGTTNPNYVSDWSVSANFTTNPCQTVCPTPINLTSTNVSASSAVLYWSSTIVNNTNTFRIRYRSSNVSSWTTLNSLGAPYQLGNLSCGTTYVWQVQTICNNQTGSNGTIPESTWSESYTFTTSSCPISCPQLTASTVANVTQNSAVLTWNFSNPATAGLYTIRYQTPNTSNWVTINNITAPYYSFANLSCATTYVWQVQQQCYTGSTTGTVSEWSQPVTFTTLACTPICETPTALNTGNITATGAVLYWNSVSSNSNVYNIRYKTSNISNWTTINYIGSQYQLGNLTCGTTYIWQVQQVCSTTSPMVLSPWSNDITFTTSACQPPPCLAPTNLQAVSITANSVYLLWNANSSATTLFNIRYQSANSNTWTTVNNVTVQHQLSNLSCATAYVWQVQQVCYTTPGTNTTSEWSNSMTFTTSACSPPTCLAPTALETESITATGAVLYWNSVSPNSNAYNIRFKTTNATNWTTINYVSSQYQLGNLSCGTTYIWQVQQVCVSAPPMALSPWSNEAIFTTSTCPPPPCLAPTNLQAVSITANSAYLLWNANTSATTLFNIRYRSANSNTWTTVNNVTIQHHLSNLSCATAYVWQVQQVCYTTPGTINTSEWSNTFTFTTSACPVVCPTPTGLETLSVTANSALITWNNSVTTNALFNLRYRKDGTTNWTTVNQVYAHYTLNGLLCNTAYIWQIQLLCYNGSNTLALSEWSNMATFTTATCPSPPCTVPSNLETTNISTTGAVLIWNSISTNTTAYNLRYKAINSTNWTTLNYVSSHYQLGNLNCATGYVWQVQQICNTSTSPMIVSPWSAEATFTTSNCPTPCLAPSGLNSLSITTNSAVLVWNYTIPATNTFNIRYRTTTTVNWTTVPNVTVQHPLTGLSCSSTYIWQVQQICSNANGITIVSPWSVEATFTTLGCPTSCPAPTVLTTTAITATSAVLVWNNATTVSASYNLRYKTNTSTGWVYVSNVTSPYTLGNLQCGVVYVWQAQQICPNSPLTVENPWSAEATFTTVNCTALCPAPTVLTTTNITTTGAVLVWNSLTSASATYNLRYRTNNTIGWVYAFAINAPYTLSNLQCGATYVWQVQQVCPNSWTVESPWSAETTFTTLNCPLPCLAPTVSGTTSITASSAVLVWNSIASTPNLYNIRYKSNNTAWVTVVNVTSPYTLDNLHCGTTYVWQVQQLCSTAAGTASVSPWSNETVFTTTSCPIVCPALNGLTATNINQNSAVLSWTNTSSIPYSYILRFRKSNTNNWVTLNNISLPYSLNNLSCGVEYVWQVQQVCSSPSGTGIATLSPWSEPASFTTTHCQDTCQAPTGLTASYISPLSAYLTWNTVNGAAYYVIRYKKAANNGSYSTVTSTTTMRQTGLLSPGTHYTWQVKAICANGSTTAGSESPWSDEAHFATPSTLSAFPNPASSILNALFWMNRNASVVIELRDSYGKLIYKQQKYATAGDNEFTMDVSSFSNGLYFLTINKGSESDTSKVLIRH